MSIPTRCRVGDVFSTASRRTTTTSPKPLTDKPDHRQAGSLFQTRHNRTDCFCGSVSRVGIHITLYTPPPPVMCHSFHTLKRNTPKATDRSLEGPFVFIDLNILLYMIISKHRRQQNPAPAQPASPSPPSPQGEGSNRIHGSCPGYCRE